MWRKLSQALSVAMQHSAPPCRGMVDESNEQFVAYFLPTPDTIEKREEDKRLGIPFRDDQEYVPMHALVHAYTPCTYMSVEGEVLAVYLHNG